jgi:hydrogenase maturation protease
MIAVIGCGNLNRSDDGAGPELIGALRSRGLEDYGARLFDAGTDGMAVMFAARGCGSLIIVDACQSGSAPGAIFEVPGGELDQHCQPSLNLHHFRWDHALFAGKKLFRDDFPSDVVVLLIEAQTVGLGIGLSPPVAAAVVTVADRIERLIQLRAAVPQAIS